MKYDVANFTRTVLKFWRSEGRHTLPWRTTRDPYKILVSEIMLQQTQVDRVVPYYERFIGRFPTVQSLAKASLRDVLQLWSGLGYNRRAKLLRECAKEVVEKHEGNVPNDMKALVALPAIGSYTAGAIRAFAFNERAIFIETNIRSALIHHFFPKSKKVADAKLVPILEEALLHISSTREWYAALMDYGSHIKKTHLNPSRRSKHHTVQSTFDGSTRQVRGAIVRKLLDGPISESTLRKLDARNSYRFGIALKALRAEGIVEKKGKKWHLADT